ncbi:MAG: hypothetical protein AAFV93_11760, partial [Chloroflexota bacterium]
HSKHYARYTTTQAKTVRDLSVWWYIWRNAYYDVAVSSVEPLLIGRDMRDVYFGRQINLVMYRNSYAMGAIRLTLHEGSAHLVAHAMLKEMREADWDKTIRAVAVDVALANDADMIFVAGKTEEDRSLYRQMGFVDSGSIVSYAERLSETPLLNVTNDTLTESVLII